MLTSVVSSSSLNLKCVECDFDVECFDGCFVGEK